MQNNTDWIFFEFFQKLRKEARIDLSMNQYQLFLQCILAKSITEVDDLRLLCETLWLTKEKYRLEFDRHFNDAIKKLLVLPQQLPQTNTPNPETSKPETGAKKGSNLPSEKEEAKPEIKEEPKTSAEKNSEDGVSKNLDNRQININIKDSGGSGDINTNHDEIRFSNFILSEYKYLPFESRTVEQGWRKMQGKPNFVKTEQLDIPKIVKLRSQQGFVGELFYERKSIGSQKIVWLSDNGGSMAPFAHWDEQLYEIMKNLPNTSSVERYYFHDYPAKIDKPDAKKDYMFFLNRSHTQVKFMSEIFKQSDKNTIFIICSDGGAARKREDMERVKVFFDICTAIRTKSRNIGWINPVKNLEMTSAKYISFFVKTEYPSNKGISKLFQFS